MNAINSFNLANSDSDSILPQTEIVHSCSAFQEILDADSNSYDIAKKFSKAFVPCQVTPMSYCKRKIVQKDGVKKEYHLIRFYWMKEFYGVRGDYAHGKQKSRRNHLVWDIDEHLFLAAIAFPLLVKLLLNRECKYALSDEDTARLNVLEKLAGTLAFLKPPSNQRNREEDFHWNRLLAEEYQAQYKVREEAAIRDGVKLLEKIRKEKKESGTIND